MKPKKVTEGFARKIASVTGSPLASTSWKGPPSGAPGLSAAVAPSLPRNENPLMEIAPSGEERDSDRDPKDDAKFCHGELPSG